MPIFRIKESNILQQRYTANDIHLEHRGAPVYEGERYRSLHDAKKYQPQSGYW